MLKRGNFISPHIHNLLTLGFLLSDTHFLLSVQNNGKAIASEDIGSIFEVFSRQEGESVPAGTGLGLAIVKEVAKRHQGNCWAESGPECKTTFYFSINQNL